MREPSPKKDTCPVFLLNLIFALVYPLLSKGIPQKSRLAKGLVFGLCVWVVAE